MHIIVTFVFSEIIKSTCICQVAQHNSPTKGNTKSWSRTDAKLKDLTTDSSLTVRFWNDNISKLDNVSKGSIVNITNVEMKINNRGNKQYKDVEATEETVVEVLTFSVPLSLLSYLLVR